MLTCNAFLDFQVILFLPEFLSFLNLSFNNLSHHLPVPSVLMPVSLNFDVQFKNNFEYTQLNKQTNSEARRIKVYHFSLVHCNKTPVTSGLLQE